MGISFRSGGRWSQEVGAGQIVVMPILTVLSNKGKRECDKRGMLQGWRAGNVALL